MNGFPYLTTLILFPLGCGILIALLPAAQARFARVAAQAASLITLLAAITLLTQFDGRSQDFQFVERYPWIPELGVDYYLGVDGLGMVMLLLTALLVPLAIQATEASKHRAGLYYGLVLTLQAGLLGTFSALNFFHFFLFWELSLVPAFFLVRFWGGTRRAEAATQFFVYTMVGSIALLLAFIGLFLAVEEFNFPELAEAAKSGQLAAAISADWGLSALQTRAVLSLIFFGVLLGFAVKIPIAPFHSWLPLTYAEAPISTVMLLTGLMSKMGVYGLVRIVLPIFPEQLRQWQTLLLGLAVFTILFSAGAAMAQKDLKRLLAFSSMGHLGFCVLGVFSVGASYGIPSPAGSSAALTGVVLQIFNHGLTAATLFWFAGCLEARSGGLRFMAEYGGLRAVTPILCGMMGIAVFASLGLPGMNGFVSEFLILKGVFALAPLSGALSLLGLLITAVYLLAMLQSVFYGPVAPGLRKVQDLDRKERLLFAVPLGLMLLLGVCPQVILRVLPGTVAHWVGLLSP